MTTLSPVSPSQFSALKASLIAAGSIVTAHSDGDTEIGMVSGERTVFFITITIRVAYTYIPALKQLQVTVQQGPTDQVIAELEKTLGVLG